MGLQVEIVEGLCFLDFNSLMLKQLLLFASQSPLQPLWADTSARTATTAFDIETFADRSLVVGEIPLVCDIVAVVVGRVFGNRASIHDNRRASVSDAAPILSAVA